MLIAVDGYEASADNLVGVGRFEVELLKNLYKNDNKNTYRIYTPAKPKPDLPSETTKWQYRTVLLNRLWSQVSLPLYLMIDRPHPDVFFSPVHYAPRFSTVPNVLGIMDLSFLYFPEMFKKTDLYKLKKWTHYSVKQARRIIAISKSTKDDILKEYNIDSDIVSVVYPGLSPGNVQNKNIKNQMSNLISIKKKYKITDDYILYVGTLQPRKNIVRLIEAFYQAITVEKRHAQKLQLVIVGKKGWLYDTIFAKVKDLGIEDKVVFTGFVPDEDLPLLYKGAKCFCLVSLYEGFGFPVLEAMQAGTPVICSNISSLPELAGSAGILVNPENTTEIAQAIINVIKMKDSEREKIIENGKKQASKFTWEKTAKQTLKILEKVGNDQR